MLVYTAPDHKWWPIFLYPLLQPWSGLFERFGTELLQPIVFEIAPRFTHDPYLLWDRVAGGVYLTGGTMWFWLIGRILGWAAVRVRHRFSRRQG